MVINSPTRQLCCHSLSLLCCCSYVVSAAATCLFSVLCRCLCAVSTPPSRLRCQAEAVNEHTLIWPAEALFPPGVRPYTRVVVACETTSAHNVNEIITIQKYTIKWTHPNYFAEILLNICGKSFIFFRCNMTLIVSSTIKLKLVEVDFPPPHREVWNLSASHQVLFILEFP